MVSQWMRNLTAPLVQRWICVWDVGMVVNQHWANGLLQIGVSCNIKAIKYQWHTFHQQNQFTTCECLQQCVINTTCHQRQLTLWALTMHWSIILHPWKTDLIFLQQKFLGTKISNELVYQYTSIFFNFLTKSNHLHPLQVENCNSNSRLVVDEDDNGKFRLERVN